MRIPEQPSGIDTAHVKEMCETVMRIGFNTGVLNEDHMARLLMVLDSRIKGGWNKIKSGEGQIDVDDLIHVGKFLNSIVSGIGVIVAHGEGSFYDILDRNLVLMKITEAIAQRRLDAMNN